jgi:hypothetical protein
LGAKNFIIELNGENGPVGFLAPTPLSESPPRFLISSSTSASVIRLTCMGPLQISRQGAPAMACLTITSKT